MTEGKGNRDLGSGISSKFLLQDLTKRTSLIFHYGVVIAVDYDAGKARVSIGNEGSKIETEWLAIIQERAGNTRKWSAPEIGEWVEILAPFGELASGIIIGCRAKPDAPNEARTSNVERTTCYVPGTDDPLILEDQYRNEAKRRRWLKDHGEFRHEIGGPYDGSGSPLSGIVQNKDSIVLRVADTQIVIKDGSIVASVKGQETELSLTDFNIVAHVKKRSIWRMVSDKITSAVDGKGVFDITPTSIVGSVEKDGHFVITKTKVGMFVASASARMLLGVGQVLLNLGTSIVELSASLISSRVPGSEHQINPASIMNNTSVLFVPSQSELTVPNPLGGSFSSSGEALDFTNPDFPAPIQLTQAPTVVKGLPPYMPLA
jgi:phage baseplate assembly protein gpV